MRANATVPSATAPLAASSSPKDKYERMTASLIDALPEHIRGIGRAYLINNPRHLINVFNTNQDIADKMVAYSAGNTPTQRDYEIFLTNRYFELPNYNGGLAESIRDFFTQYFKKPLTASQLIKNISTTTLQEIGIAYLNAHPEPSPWYALMKHDNQVQATKLKECKIISRDTGQPVPVQTPMDLWLFLLYVYETLPSEKGELARKIENMITNLFQLKFEKMDVSGGSHRIRSTPEIAHSVKYDMIEKIKAACSSNELQEFKLGEKPAATLR
jgi:hypothetical protein